MAGSATIGALRVVLGLDSAAFTDGLNAAQKHLKGVSKRLQAVGASMAQVGAGMSAAISAPLVGLGALAVGEAVEMRDAVGQVSTALKSMGDIGGRSLEQLTAQAEKLASSSLFEDDQILRDVTANLLTFGNVAGEQFDRAQVAIIDIATRMKKDLLSTTIMVGKALNDPIAGMTALGRAGVQLTDDQKRLIKEMTGLGNVAGAQKIILGELERQFGGASKAARDAASPMERMNLSLKAMAGDIGKVLLPILDKLSRWFSDLTERFGQLSPQMQKFVVIAGAIAAAIGPVLVVLGGITMAIGALLPVLAAVGAPLLAIAAAAAAVGAAFYVFRDDLIPIMQNFAAALQENIGPKLAPLWEAIKGAVSAVGLVFSQIFGDGSPGGATEAIKMFGEIAARVWGATIDVITGAINVVSNVLRAFGALLRGDFSAMWGYLGQAVMAAVKGIGAAFQTLFPEVIGWVKQTWQGVKMWLVDKFVEIVQAVAAKCQAVAGFFRDLWDAVVGHSYIPDMVKAIADWMGPRLQDAMVFPANDATAETAAAFGSMTASIDDQMKSLFQSIASKDWKGALGGVFEMLGGAGGKLGSFGKLGSAILGVLPGFKTGGSFKVGGSGGLDSQTVAFRATPGEMVDIRKPGNDNQAGGAMRLSVEPSPYFDVHVREVSSSVAAGMVVEGVKHMQDKQARAQRAAGFGYRR